MRIDKFALMLYIKSMKIFILKKSISDLKNPIERVEYETEANTVERFICEMVEKNYARRPVKDALAECKRLALDEFRDGGYYIVNQTKNHKYKDAAEPVGFAEGDEVVLIKLKYVRDMLWL